MLFALVGEECKAKHTHTAHADQEQMHSCHTVVTEGMSGGGGSPVSHLSRGHGDLVDLITLDCFAALSRH